MRFVVLALILLCASAKGEEYATLTLAADPWCPYNCTPHSEREGYLVEIARAVFESQGYQLQYINLPWRRALEFSRQGLTDGALGVIQGNVYGNVIGNESLGLDETVLLVRKGEAFAYAGATSLANRRIGVITHYSYDNGGEIDQFIAAHADDVEVLYHEAALESLLLMLVSGRIDVVLENRYVAAYRIKQLQLTPRIEFISTGVKNPVFIGFTPDTRGKIHATLLDEGIRLLRQQGRLAAILSRYGLSDWQAGQAPASRSSADEKSQSPADPAQVD